MGDPLIDSLLAPTIADYYHISRFSLNILSSLFVQKGLVLSCFCRAYHHDESKTALISVGNHYLHLN